MGLNWLINTLELLLMLFSANSYYFRLNNGLIGELIVFLLNFWIPPFHTESPRTTDIRFQKARTGLYRPPDIVGIRLVCGPFKVRVK